MEFEEDKLKNKHLIELLCIKTIIDKIKVKDSIISINEISFRVLALYWQIKIDESNNDLKHVNLNVIRSNLITQYGLSMESKIVEIEQILNYIEDKSLQIRLYSIIKSSLKSFSYPHKNMEQNNYIITKLNELEINKEEFFKINTNVSIKVNSNWGIYFKQNEIFLKFIETKIQELKDGLFEEISLSKPIIKAEIKNDNKDFDILFKLEKRMEFHMNLNKIRYSCLEEALEWMDMDIDKYRKIHSSYIDYINLNDFKVIKIKLPLVTSAMLIFTAIYRYNDEDATGFWPEFFGNKDDYNYSKDVIPSMQCISYMSKFYKIDTDKRRYLQKKNLAEIFSQIYIPQVSLMKVFSVIYSFYFKNKNKSHLINKTEFIEINEYRLDKPGFYFISEDKIKEDIFYDIVEMIKDGIRGSIDINKELPRRFYSTLDYWLEYDKKEIDKSKEEYYIASPNIMIDCINQEIKIFLPKQKSRIYSDEEFRWDISIDGNKIIVPGRIIRQKNGSYLILEERIKINTFKQILVEYIFNNKKLGTWEFKNESDIVIFDKGGTLLNKENIRRDGCFLSIPKTIKLDNEVVLDRYEIDGWENYIFYYIDLAEYKEKELRISNQILIPIEDRPVVERKEFKFLFEEYNMSSFDDNVNIYENFGVFNIVSPFIEEKDIQIIFDDIEEKKDKTNYIKIKSVNKSRIQLNFDCQLASGVYSLIIKYKNKSIYRESFIVDRITKVKKEYEVSYNQQLNNTKRMRIYNNPEIKIQPYHLNTKVEKIESEYIIDTVKSSVARVLYKKGNSEILIRQIVKPIKLELTGLEEIIDPDENDKIKDITKEVLYSNDINLYIKNLDNNYKYLTYKLTFMDDISEYSVVSTTNIKFGDEFNWNFKELKDRIIDFKNIYVTLSVLNEKEDNIYNKTLLRIKNYIDIYDFKIEKYENNSLFINWREKQKNNQRKISLYNITIPSDDPIELDLEDGVMELRIDLNAMKYGVYMPLIEFKKKDSLFDTVEINREFLNRDDIKNVFINNIEKNGYKGQQELAMCIWYIYKEEYEDLYFIIKEFDLLGVELYPIFSSILQMKYFVKDTKLGNKALFDTTYSIIESLLKNHTKDELVKNITELKGKFIKMDLSYILTSVLAFKKGNSLEKETIDSLTDFNLISALCSLENGKSALSEHIIKECRKNFDNELLSPDVIRDYDKVFGIIASEITIINGFWSWLTEYKNRHLLNYAYSKARLFRMYVEENNISTFKVLGRTIDDMVDNMVNGDHYLTTKLPKRWHKTLNVKKDLFDSFTNVINENIQGNYIDILKAAFISVVRPSLYDDKEYFDLMMKCELSNQKEIFDRYKAYIKLVFI